MSQPARKRNRATSRAAGTRLETQLVRYLQEHITPDIERRAKNGALDRGDIAGLRHMGQRVVVECKNTSRISLSEWATEAEIERGNDDAGVGVIAHKRHGKGQPGDQWITMTWADFVSLITGERPE